MNIKTFSRSNLPHKLLLTTTQKTKLRNPFENNMSTDIKLSKTQIFQIIQSGGLLGLLLSKLAGPLMKVAIQLAKNILDPLGITAAASAIDAEIQKKMHGPGTTILMISNEEMNEILKFFKVLFKILIFYWKELLKQLKMKQNNKKDDF